MGDYNNSFFNSLHPYFLDVFIKMTSMPIFVDVMFMLHVQNVLAFQHFCCMLPGTKENVNIHCLLLGKVTIAMQVLIPDRYICTCSFKIVNKTSFQGLRVIEFVCESYRVCLSKHKQ